MKRGSSRTYGLSIAGITAAGFLLRAVFLARQPLWRDEAFTALAVQHPTQQMLDIVGHDSAPPLVYLIDRLLTHLLPQAPATLRLLPLLAGTAAIPLAAALGRRVLGEGGGVWAAIAMAVLPAPVISSRDARMYALAGALVLAVTLAAWRLVERPGAARWLLLTCLIALAWLTDYFVLLPLGAVAVAVVIIWHPSPRVIASLLGAGIAAVAPLIVWVLVRARAQFTHTQGGFWVEPIGPKTVLGTVVQFFSGPPIDPGIPFKLALQTFQGVAVAAGLLAAVVLVARRGALTPEGRRAAAYLAIAGGGGTVALALVSVWRPLLDARYASVGWGPLIVLTGVGAALVDSALLRRAGAIAVLVCSVVLSAAISHPDTPAAVAYLEESVPNAFVDAGPAEYLLVRYYAQPGLAARTHVIAAEVSWFWGTAVYPEGAVLPAIPGSVLRARTPIAYVDDAPASPPPAPPGYHRDGTECFTTACVTLFTASP